MQLPNSAGLGIDISTKKVYYFVDLCKDYGEINRHPNKDLGIEMKKYTALVSFCAFVVLTMAPTRSEATCEYPAACWIDVAGVDDGDGIISVKADGSLVGTHTVNPPTDLLKNIDAGNDFWVGIRTDNSMFCWSSGNDQYGQVDDCPTTGTWKQTDAEGYSACGVDVEGYITCWGQDTAYGVVTNAPTTGGHTKVDVGFQSACALDSDRKAVCWGRDQYGQVSGAPTASLLDISCNRFYCAAVKASDGSLIAWGKAGLDVIDDLPTGAGFVSIAAGKMDAAALDWYGNNTMWGRDFYGIKSAEFPGVGSYHMIEVTERRACAIVADAGTSTLNSGDVQCWGYGGEAGNHEDAADGCL